MSEKPKYHIGDVVRIKNSVGELVNSPAISFVDEMRKYLGFIGIIQSIKEVRSIPLYELTMPSGTPMGKDKVNGNGYWLWDEHWLDPADMRQIDISTDDLLEAFL